MGVELAGVDLVVVDFMRFDLVGGGGGHPFVDVCTKLELS